MWHRVISIYLSTKHRMEQNLINILFYKPCSVLHKTHIPKISDLTEGKFSQGYQNHTQSSSPIWPGGGRRGGAETTCADVNKRELSWYSRYSNQICTVLSRIIKPKFFYIDFEHLFVDFCCQNVNKLFRFDSAIFFCKNPALCQL